MNREQIPLNQNFSGISSRQLVVFCEMKLKEGYKKEAIFNAMVKEGCSPQDARMIIEEAVMVWSSHAQKLTVGGLILSLLGIGITCSTYRTAYEAGGGRYMICFGAVICGIVCAAAGLRLFMRLR